MFESIISFFQKRKIAWIWLTLGGVLLFMSLNYHSKAKPFTYQSQIWADKAGYNVYLPYVLIYAGNTIDFPDSIEVRTGNGFSLDRANNTLHTKYTYGTAFLQAPFFIGAHIFASISGQENDGYSQPYQTAIDFAGVFYCLLGLYLLFNCLRIETRNKYLIGFTLFAILFGSNLLYYAIDETGMSHIYSFFLFSFFLYLITKSQFLKNDSIKWYILLGFTFGLITLIRPTNAIIVLVFFFWRLDNRIELKERLSRLGWNKNLSKMKAFVIPVCIALVWLPQMTFWKFQEGTWFYYSYGQEGFDFLHPKFWQVLFSAKIGAFVYGPILILAAIGMIQMIIKKSKNGILYTGIFIFVAYITASWHISEFGCSYGMRNYVEYFALFAFPIMGLFDYFSNRKKLVQVTFSSVVLAMIVFNVLLVYAYGGCSFLTSHWDYKGVILKLSEL